MNCWWILNLTGMWPLNCVFPSTKCKFVTRCTTSKNIWLVLIMVFKVFDNDASATKDILHKKADIGGGYVFFLQSSVNISRRNMFTTLLCFSNNIFIMVLIFINRYWQYLCAYRPVLIFFFVDEEILVWP